MFIVGCDYHPSFQQIAFVDTETGELKEQRLMHREGAEDFYRALAATKRQHPTRVPTKGRDGCEHDRCFGSRNVRFGVTFRSVAFAP